MLLHYGLKMKRCYKDRVGLDLVSTTPSRCFSLRRSGLVRSQTQTFLSEKARWRKRGVVVGGNKIPGSCCLKVDATYV